MSDARAVDVSKAEAEVVNAVLNYLVAQHGSQENPHLDAEQEYASEGLALTARDLYLATEALPRDARPVEWNTKPHNGVVPVMLTEREITAILQALEVRKNVMALAESALEERLQGELRSFSWFPADGPESLQ